MIIFKKKYRKACEDNDRPAETDEMLITLIKEAEALVNRAEQGVKSERSPITIVEKIQISDTTKLVKKLIIDIDKDIKKGRPSDKNAERLKNAMAALKTSIENIL